jgi:zinc/manganese transport system ATP-binding protein
MLYHNHDRPPRPNFQRRYPPDPGRCLDRRGVARRSLGDPVSPPPIRLDHLTLRHDTREAVRDLTGTFASGSLTALTGENGAGKTTLLQALAGLHPPSSGSIDRGGLKPSDIALLPQGSQLDRSFPIACRDVVALGLSGRIGPFRGIGQRQLREAEQALASVGLPDLGGRAIGAMSAGQFQRVLFARLMLQDAAVLLLDEPFAAVDTATAHDLLRILQRWHKQGRTIVTVLHDLDMARAHFPETLHLGAGQAFWGPTVGHIAPWAPRVAA